MHKICLSGRQEIDRVTDRHLADVPAAKIEQLDALGYFFRHCGILQFAGDDVTADYLP